VSGTKTLEPEKVWIYRRPLSQKVEPSFRLTKRLAPFFSYANCCTYGVPAKIFPSFDNIGASNVPVVLGDGTYWAIRLVTDEKSGIRVYTEATGLVENGNVGMSCFMRADGELLYTDTGSPAPFTYIRNHS